MKVRLSLVTILVLVLPVISFVLHAGCGRRCSPTRRVRGCCGYPRPVCKPEVAVGEEIPAVEIPQEPLRIKRPRPWRDRVIISRKRRARALNGYLFESVKEGHLAEVQLALTERAHVNARDLQQRIPLHYAIGTYNPKGATKFDEIAIYLIDNGADVYARDTAGIAPIDLIRQRNNLWLLDYLRTKGLIR